MDRFFGKKGVEVRKLTNATTTSPSNPWDHRYADEAAGGVKADHCYPGSPIHYTLHPFLYKYSISLPLTGSTEKWWLNEVACEYLKPPPATLLSIGCGTAIVEEWIVANNFAKHVVAFEMAPSAVEVARKRLALTPYASQLDVRSGDVLAAGLEDSSFDVVFVESAIHHFDKIEEMFQLIHRVLKPNGLLIYDEYVGPDHHQHPAELYAIMDQINECLDPHYRVDFWSGKLRENLRRSTLDEMLAHDASEGVHASLVLPLTYQYFEVLQRKDFGGAILRTFFTGILQNFNWEDGKDQSVARLIILMEQLLVKNGIIPSHNSNVVARRRPAPLPPLTVAECERITYADWKAPEDYLDRRARVIPDPGVATPMLFTRQEDLILDDFVGSIRYHYEDQAEPHEEDFLVFSHFPGQDEVFLDIGAATGISVSSFRKFNRSAKVISFEAAPWLEPALAWLKDREPDRFSYFMVGAGRASEVRELYIPCLDNTPNFYLASFVARRFGPDPIVINAMKELMGSPGTYSVCKVDVQIEPIDKFALAPSLVKIDTETFEFDVLLGMVQTIHDHRPLFMIECGNRNQDVAAFFESRAYLFAEREGTQLRISNRIGSSDNGFFVPEERLPEYERRGLIPGDKSLLL